MPAGEISAIVSAVLWENIEMLLLVLLCNAAGLLSAVAWVLLFLSPSIDSPLDWNFFCARGMLCFLYPGIALLSMLCSVFAWRLGYKVASGVLPLFPPAVLILVMQRSLA